MKVLKQITGKILYGILFLVVLPLVLVLWAESTEAEVLLPPVLSTEAGTIMMISGGLLMLWSMWSLLKYGKGLPMNAYPPRVYVSQGPYRIVRHPIYVGFIILMTGYFLFTGSPSGFWLVIPLTIIGIVSLTIGYENPDIHRRFPGQTHHPIFGVPDHSTERPSFTERFSSSVMLMFLIMLNNFLIYTVKSHFNPVHPGPDLMQNFSAGIADYGCFLLVALIPFFINTKSFLRQLIISEFLALGALYYIIILIPEIIIGIYPPATNIFFSAPAFLAFISVRILYRQSGLTSLAYTFILLLAVLFHAAESQSEIIYLTGSLIVFLVASYYVSIWVFMRNLAEKIANSWKEWVFGKVRILNRGFYIGAGTFSGLLLAAFLTGKEYIYALLIFSIIVTITSALWAQLIEGSSKLKRPFGFYGGLVGIIFGSLVIWALDYNVWVVIGVASVVMPWMQAIGRLGCLVNGCCHGGRVDDPLIGIRYYHPRSRVCHLSGLKGELLHPTQLYSIIWLFFTGILMLNIWFRGLPFSFIFGIYLILTGLGRFIEESYRGEVQTPGFRGLRLYQWTAIVSVIIGIIMTFIHSNVVRVNPDLSLESILMAAITGLFLFFAMGVDFPYSNARFSRLV